MENITLYSKDEFLQIIRNAKKRKKEWQERTEKELRDLQNEIELSKLSHRLDL